MAKTTIRLTGRKSLPQNAFDFEWVGNEEGVITRLSIIDYSVLAGFPADARIRVALRENKNINIVDFGTLDNLTPSVQIYGILLISPSAELRVIQSHTEEEHLLLGSVKLPKIANKGDAEGILHFQVKNTTPLLWELVIEEDAYPVLYLSDRLEEKVDPVLWVRSNHLFMITVFPELIDKVFRYIFSNDSPTNEGWMTDWITWAESAMGCPDFPVDANEDQLNKWLADSISTITGKMGLLDDFISGITDEIN